MRTFQQFQEAKADALIALKLLGKKSFKSVKPDVMKLTKQAIRNERGGFSLNKLGTTARISQNQLKAMDYTDAKKILAKPGIYRQDDINFAKHIDRFGKKSSIPGQKIEKPDKYLNLSLNRRSAHVPTANRTQAQVEKTKETLIKKANKRRIKKELDLINKRSSLKNTYNKPSAERPKEKD